MKPKPPQTSNWTLGSSSLRDNDVDSDNVPRTTAQGRAAGVLEHRAEIQPGKFNCNVQIQVVTDRTYRLKFNIVNELLIHFISWTFSWDRCWIQALLLTLKKPHMSTVKQVLPITAIFLELHCSRCTFRGFVWVFQGEACKEGKNSSKRKYDCVQHQILGTPGTKLGWGYRR